MGVDVNLQDDATTRKNHESFGFGSGFADTCVSMTNPLDSDGRFSRNSEKSIVCKSWAQSRTISIIAIGPTSGLGLLCCSVDKQRTTSLSLLLQIMHVYIFSGQ